VETGDLRGDFDGLAEGGDGLGQLLLVVQNSAEAPVSPGVIRVGFDRRV
jgi:hypothetical protein